MAITQITSLSLVDDAVTLAKIGATGTASSSTFLQGDNSWATQPILQMVSHENNQTTTLTGDLTSWQEINSNWRLAITPKSASSNLILNAYVCFNQYSGNNYIISHMRFYDVTNSAAVAIGQGSGSRNQASAAFRYPHYDSNDAGIFPIMGRAASSNTNARTYTVQFHSESSSASYAFNYSSGDNAHYGWTAEFMFTITEVLA